MKRRKPSASCGESRAISATAPSEPAKAAAAPAPKKAEKKVAVVVEESDDEIEELAPIVVEKVKKDGFPAGSTEDDQPPMAFERNKMLGGKKVKMSKKPWPAHCWENQEGGAYLGVWDVERKTFDTDYDEPIFE
jgi:hypothetical protein